HKQRLLNRRKTIEGHVRGVQRMVEAEAYCIDLLNQTRAIRSALTTLDTLILEEHLRTCVATAVQSDNVADRERVLRELLQVFESLQGQAPKTERE
ncbi:MAG: metal-sensitive transcriptional regulator, partial [Chloroflexaceae bacterium]|nr:metal-sensitive transcriptional regulator [Chloroflexaceae bacterium]